MVRGTSKIKNTVLKQNYASVAGEERLNHFIKWFWLSYSGDKPVCYIMLMFGVENGFFFYIRKYFMLVLPR